ncbi:hypothetical protein [Roseibium sp. MMSF_3544]|uniref:hypothetical protein n=1 Tax=unclassified Roseibium TaxID=2629323 RepID=UPI00273FA2F2|nr:hypothetical protein [Roseibium sp. MMSF_3544]
MFFGFLAGAILYGAFTLVFLIVSSAELLENVASTPSRLMRVFLISVFWPVSLLVLAVRALLVRFGRPILRSNGSSEFLLFQRSI